jgi:outer membrane murein-binding lipoprotein Lpp
MRKAQSSVARRWSLIAASVATVLLAGCATAEKIDAAADIRTFLLAVRDGDRATFDAHVDKPALKANIEARLLAAEAGSHGAESREALGALLARPLVSVAVDALARPEVFRAAAELAGYGPETRIPGPLVLGQDLQPMPDERICALIRHRCAFVFRREDGVWKLIDFEGDLGLLTRPRAPR